MTPVMLEDPITDGGRTDTVATSVTGWLVTEGLTELDIVMFVGAGAMTTLVMAEVLVRKFTEPVYTAVMLRVWRE